MSFANLKRNRDQISNLLQAAEAVGGSTEFTARFAPTEIEDFRSKAMFMTQNSESLIKVRQDEQ